ncbi:hypothetical protein Q5P01_008783 [Channa striata]|uniref:Uncharacterized protein n=1 Tax=Channa striata TaxID=64152 RepID=A0AA88N5M7_CHASR|nr:hypothetical protein Q5P01_008783 [Channa striata]
MDQRDLAPPLTHLRLMSAVSLHLLSAAASSTHALLLWTNPAHSQEGGSSARSAVSTVTCYMLCWIPYGMVAVMVGTGRGHPHGQCGGLRPGQVQHSHLHVLQQPEEYCHINTLWHLGPHL